VEARLKVLHVYRTYFPDPPGGLQEAIHQISTATQAMGVEPTVFTLSPCAKPSTIEVDGIKVVRGHSWAEWQSCNIGSWQAIAAFRQLAKNTDIIHYHFPWPFADLLNRFVSKRKPKVMTYHSDIVRQRWLGVAYKPALRSMLSSMDRIVATSRNYINTSPVLQDQAWRDRVDAIPLGIKDRDQAQCSQRTQREGGNGSAAGTVTSPALDKLGLSVGKPYFLFIGALRYYKGLPYLIEASARVRAKIVVVGTGPELHKLSRQAQSIEHANVVFAGLVNNEDKFELLRHCRALVLPSHRRSEAFGMTLVEASMFAKPMISCEIGTGTSYVNIHDETGLVVPPESPAALADAMNILLADEALCQGLGLGARDRYDALFNGNALGQAYVGLYRTVLDRARAKTRPSKDL